VCVDSQRHGGIAVANAPADGHDVEAGRDELAHMGVAQFVRIPPPRAAYRSGPRTSRIAE
jgi:hypothetical protein